MVLSFAFMPVMSVPTEGEEWSSQLMSSPGPVSRFCEWCPFTKREDVVVHQSVEESGECIYEPSLDACMNGGVECFADEEGKVGCMWSEEF
jgi:hypothetical protein